MLILNLSVTGCSVILLTHCLTCTPGWCGGGGVGLAVEIMPISGETPLPCLGQSAQSPGSAQGLDACILLRGGCKTVCSQIFFFQGVVVGLEVGLSHRVRGGPWSHWSSHCDGPRAKGPGTHSHKRPACHVASLPFLQNWSFSLSQRSVISEDGSISRNLLPPLPTKKKNDVPRFWSLGVFLRNSQKETQRECGAISISQFDQALQDPFVWGLYANVAVIVGHHQRPGAMA